MRCYSGCRDLPCQREAGLITTQHAHLLGGGKGFTSRLRRPLPCLRWGACGWSFFASIPMAVTSQARCEIRAVAVHCYADGVKQPGHSRVTIFFGRSGRPVTKMRLIPAELAYAIARRLQARRIGTISVI
jgi:hypothetical protein